MDPTCEIPKGRHLAPHEFPDPAIDAAPTAEPQTAVLAGGCFWCVEAVFKEIDGVLEVTSGYSGGTSQTADYETVCSGRTNHAEAVEVRFDPNRVSYGQLLKVFFSVAHDPTQLNRQGADQGRQYRSAVFYADEEQKRVAEAYIQQLNAAGAYDSPVVTEVAPLEAFYQAEAYHQDYAERHPMQPYVMFAQGGQAAQALRGPPEGVTLVHVREAGPKASSVPPGEVFSGDQRAAAPERRHAPQATVRVADIGATHVAAELARRARGAGAAAGLDEQGGRRQVAGRLGLPARESGQELRGRGIGHRGRRRLRHGLRERDESEKGEEDENGLLHRIISL